MQRAVLCLSLLMLTNLCASVECDFVQNLLQRGARPSTWKWTSKSPDVQRHRRFLPDDTAAWWKEMQSLRNQRTTLLSSLNPLNPEEDIYFSGKFQLHPPFDRIESAPITTTSTTTTQPPIHDNLDPTFVRELIIEEHHKPSKTELESASQRLREANDAILKEESSNRTGEDDSKSIAAGPASFVEYVVPGVEHVLPQVEYVSELDAVRELEHLSLRPSVEYIEPFVEYVEPKIQYISTTRKTDISEKVSSVHITDDSTSADLEREFEEYEPIPYEESITIDRKRFLQFRSKNDPSGSKHHHLLRGGEETVRRSRIHRRNPEIGVPEVDYPTLEILPVVHFPCEEYPEPGYYADVTSRCQMFHICHGDGQRSSFLCPVGTVFNQDYLVCDWWYNVDCTNSLKFVDEESQEDFHKANKLIAASSNIQKEIDNTTIVKPVPKQQSMEKIQQKPTYKKSHGKDLSNNKLTKLSKKAINYPMGYAILLREYMKTSPGYLQNLTNVEDKTEKSNERNVDEDGLKSNKLKPKSYFKQKQEYYGGLKPFTLSEKTVQESTHIKRIKMKHPPDQFLNRPETSLPSSPRIRNHAVWYGERDMVSPTLESLRHYRKDKTKDAITPSYEKTNSSLLNRSLNPGKNVTESYEAMHSIQRFTQVKVNPKITELIDNRNNPRSNPKRYFLNNSNNDADSKMKLSNPAQRYTFNQTAQKKYEQILPAVSGVVGENASSIDLKNKPLQKKAYILEPNPRNMKLSKRYGERLCFSCRYKNKPSTIVNETKHGGSATSVAKRTTSFIKPIKVHNVAKNQTEHPDPVYFKRETVGNDTERRNMKGDITNLDIAYENIPLSAHDEMARSEYYYTSKFIKRISNLVSEIKSHSDSYEEMYPISSSFVHPFLNGLNFSKDESSFREAHVLSDKEKIQKMDLTLMLNISNPQTGSHSNVTNIDKLNSTVANNSNHSLVRTGNGGYVIVKKVRVKSSLVNPEDIRDNAEMRKHENVRYYSLKKDNSSSVST